MGKTRGIGAPDDVLTIASQLECIAAVEKEKFSKISRKCRWKVRKLHGTGFIFFLHRRKKHGELDSTGFVQRAYEKYGIEARTRKEKLSPSSFIPNLNRPTRQMNVQLYFPLDGKIDSNTYLFRGPPFSFRPSDITIFRASTIRWNEARLSEIHGNKKNGILV